MRNKSVTITLTKPGERAPENLLANAELHFNNGLLAGLRLTGFALWRATANDGRRFVSVTFPTRAVEKGTRVHYYDHLRGGAADIKRFKAAIVAAYREWTRANEVESTPDRAEQGTDAPAEDTPF